MGVFGQVRGQFVDWLTFPLTVKHVTRVTDDTTLGHFVENVAEWVGEDAFGLFIKVVTFGTGGAFSV